MAEENGPGVSLLWFLGLAALVVLGLVIAARSHNASVAFVGILLCVISVVAAFRLIAYLQDKAWRGENGAHRS